MLGTARRAKHAFLLELGADELIDHTATDFADAVSGLDVVIDPISGEYGLRSLQILAPHGRLIDVRGTGPDRTAIIAAADALGLRYVPFGFKPVSTDLARLAALVENGSVRPSVELVLPLAEAAQAHRRSESGQVSGKIVLIP